MMCVVMRRWRERARRTGWALIGVGVLVRGCWVIVRALGARTTDTFNQWVGWANILALLVGASGTALVAFDKVARRRDTGQLAVQAAVDLAVEVERVWAREATLRQVDNRPAPVM